MKIKKKQIAKIFKVISKIIIVLVVLLTIHQIAYATEGQPSLQDSKIVAGTESLVNAIISWLVGISITVCGGYFIYYVYCLKTNDEGETRTKMQNIKTTLICMILITCGLALIDAILAFYK